MPKIYGMRRFLNEFKYLKYIQIVAIMFSMRSLAKLTKLLPLLSYPVLLTLHQKNPHCFFWNSKKTNIIQDRVYIDVEVSNKPCEDRSATRQLTNIKGYAVAVFDGHGGWQVSHLCSKILLERLDVRIGSNKGKYESEEQIITASLREAFMDVENEFLEVAKKGYKLGFGRMARAGSCALVCVVANDKIYSANAGDSLGLIIKQEQNRMGFVEVNRELNANRAEERERLKELFPKESDIVICKRDNNTACYVKGRLQPTRSLGDLRLKHAEFNNPESLSSDHDYQHPLKVFTGPYITWEPQIMVFQIEKGFKSLVLASDGLWDELERQEVAELFKSNETKKMPGVLIQRAMEKAAADAQKTVQELRSIPAGKKRKLHDDITVVVVDLENQKKE